MANGIIRQEGALALYKGLSAGLLRQATYTTARLGTFNSISESLKIDGRVRRPPHIHTAKDSWRISSASRGSKQHKNRSSVDAPQPSQTATGVPVHRKPKPYKP